MMGQNCAVGLDFGVGAATMPWLKPALQDPWSLRSRERNRNAARDRPGVLRSLGTPCPHPAPAVTRGMARSPSAPRLVGCSRVLMQSWSHQKHQRQRDARIKGSTSKPDPWDVPNPPALAPNALQTPSSCCLPRKAQHNQLLPLSPVHQ